MYNFLFLFLAVTLGLQTGPERPMAERCVPLVEAQYELTYACGGTYIGGNLPSEISNDEASAMAREYIWRRYRWKAPGFVSLRLVGRDGPFADFTFYVHVDKVSGKASISWRGELHGNGGVESVQGAAEGLERVEREKQTPISDESVVPPERYRLKPVGVTRPAPFPL